MTKILVPTVLLTCCLSPAFVLGQRLSDIQLRDIDIHALEVVGYAKELHEEFHDHFEGVRYAAKLDELVTELEASAEHLHEFAHGADHSARAMRHIRSDTNELIRSAVRIGRTINIFQSHLRSSKSHRGIHHLKDVSSDLMKTIVKIDYHLPVDPGVVDHEANILEKAVVELHDEFHEHLEGYQVSRHLDDDLEDLEGLTKHIHDIAHSSGRSSKSVFRHLAHDVRDIKKLAGHIDGLLVQQARLGVRDRDWIGIEHLRDAVTDVVGSAYLLEHMIDKSDRQARPTRQVRASPPITPQGPSF